MSLRIGPLNLAASLVVLMCTAAMPSHAGITYLESSIDRFSLSFGSDASRVQVYESYLMAFEPVLVQANPLIYDYFYGRFYSDSGPTLSSAQYTYESHPGTIANSVGNHTVEPAVPTGSISSAVTLGSLTPTLRNETCNGLDCIQEGETFAILNIQLAAGDSLSFNADYTLKLAKAEVVEGTVHVVRADYLLDSYDTLPLVLTGGDFRDEASLDSPGSDVNADLYKTGSFLMTVENASTNPVSIRFELETLALTAYGGVNPVPEPQTWVLAMGGLAVVGVVAQRRRRVTR